MPVVASLQVAGLNDETAKIKKLVEMKKENPASSRTPPQRFVVAV